MGNKVSFELDANSDGAVAAGRRLRAQVDELKAAFPGVSVAARLVGDAIKVTMTEAVEKTQTVSKALQQKIVLLDVLRGKALEYARSLDHQAEAATEAAQAELASRTVDVMRLKESAVELTIRLAHEEEDATAKSVANLEKLAAASARANQKSLAARMVPLGDLQGAALSYGRALDAEKIKKTTQGVDLMSKSIRSSNLLMMEGARAAQDFAQVVGQTGLSGAVRASANNIQRMVEIVAFMNPGLKAGHLVATMLATAALPILGDAFFSAGEKANEMGAKVDAANKKMQEATKLAGDIAKFGEENAQAELVREVGPGRAALQEKARAENLIVEAAERKAGDLERRAEKLKKTPGAVPGVSPEGVLSAFGDLVGAVVPSAGRELSRVRTAAAQVLVDARRAREAASKLRKETSAAQARRLADFERTERINAAEEAARGGGSIAEVFEKQFTAGTKAEQGVLAERTNEFELQRAIDAGKRGGRPQGFQDREKEVKAREALKAESERLQLKMIDETRAARIAAQATQGILFSALINSRVPIVPNPFMQR